MEPKFIELHDILKNNPTSVNIAHIINFRVYEKDGVTVFETSDGNNYAVSESYAEIKQLIHDSGILIHRADPRLDETHRLTMEDLQDMIGEPIWNSNVLHWYLVDSIQTDPDGSNEKVILRTRGGAELPFDEDDLIKYPLYRMRRE